MTVKILKKIQGERTKCILWLKKGGKRKDMVPLCLTAGKGNNETVLGNIE